MEESENQVSASDVANPIAVAIAAAVLRARVWDETSCAEFAARVAADLESEGIEIGDWRDAVHSLMVVDHTPTGRRRAERIVRKHPDVLDMVARHCPEIARLHPVDVDGVAWEDRMLQAGTGDAAGLSLSEAVLDQRFLSPGRFSGMPDGVQLPVEIYCSEKRDGGTISIQETGSAFLARLGENMRQQWHFLHDRASAAANSSALSVNTLNRYGYNTFGVRKILRDLDDRNVRDARTLLVTAYETPVHELLDSERVAEILAVDLAREPCEVVAEKYAGHPLSGKLSLSLIDYSCLAPDFQESEVEKLLAARDAEGRPDAQAIREHFASIASGDELIPLPFEAGTFHAVHLPFVVESLHLGPMTSVMAACRTETGRSGLYEYEEFLGMELLRSEEFRRATLAVMGHAIAETRRITRRGGLVVMNIWARAAREEADVIRLSDARVSREEFDRLTSGFERLWSGHPQPSFPMTVAHVLATRVS